MVLSDTTVQRATKVGNLLVNDKKTIREIAKIMNVSKTTVHRDVTERLPRVDPILANKVRAVLEDHARTRHILGGEAVKKRFNGDTR